MKVTVELIKENADGSADAKVNFDKQGLEVLIQWGIVSLLTKGIDVYAVRPEDVSFPAKPKNRKKQAKK